METIDVGKEKSRKYAYVSLYGAKSIDEVKRNNISILWKEKQEKRNKPPLKWWLQTLIYKVWKFSVKLNVNSQINL